MLQIEKERSLAKPNQLPAGPRKKRLLGRLFSSFRYYSHLMVISDFTVLTLGPASQQPVPVLEPGKGQHVSPRSQHVSWSGHSTCSDPQSPRV